jgi:PhnB protein
MIRMNPYLNFDGTAEAAFTFYKSILGGEFSAIHRMSSAPGSEALSENERGRLLHIALPVNDNFVLMGSDILPSMGHTLQEGNNIHLSLHPNSREEAERLFYRLSEGGVIEMPLMDTFWGAYFGNFKDKFGIKWMVDYNADRQ